MAPSRDFLFRLKMKHDYFIIGFFTLLIGGLAYYVAGDIISLLASLG